MHVHAHAHMLTCTHTFTCLLAHTQSLDETHAQLSVCTHMDAHTCQLVCICMYKYKCTSVCPHTHMHTQALIQMSGNTHYIHTCMRKCTYSHTCAYMSMHPYYAHSIHTSHTTHLYDRPHCKPKVHLQTTNSFSLSLFVSL